MWWVGGGDNGCHQGGHMDAGCQRLGSSYHLPSAMHIRTRRPTRVVASTCDDSGAAPAVVCSSVTAEKDAQCTTSTFFVGDREADLDACWSSSRPRAVTWVRDDRGGPVASRSDGEGPPTTAPPLCTRIRSTPVASTQPCATCAYTWLRLSVAESAGGARALAGDRPVAARFSPAPPRRRGSAVAPSLARSHRSLAAGFRIPTSDIRILHLPAACCSCCICMHVCMLHAAGPLLALLCCCRHG
jgi:hypothetical protein